MSKHEGLSDDDLIRLPNELGLPEGTVDAASICGKLYVGPMSAYHRLTHPRYRPDIDGLRALAVLSVIGYHAFPDWFRGGFIGVDVFFVISGFLISSIIFENLNQGTFSFAEFYARRIRRIFPALIVVLMSCYAFGWFTLLADEYQQLGKHIAAGAGFISNFVLWDESGYFDNAAETKPLLHLWSLGIEEQFYIAWPLLLWLAWRSGFGLAMTAGIVAVLSFVLNLNVADKDVVADFYSPLTRYWELSAGALLAWTSLYRQEVTANAQAWLSSQLTRIGLGLERESAGQMPVEILSVTGFTLLLASIFLIDQTVNFPGTWAAIPVLGTVLIILSDQTAWINRQLLSSKVAVLFGLISFPLYLWHWPLLTFPRIIASEEPSLVIRVAAIGVAVVLAWLTHRLVERPWRFGRHGKAKVLVLMLLMAAVGSVGYATNARSGFGFRASVRGFVDNRNELVRTPATDAACLAYVGMNKPPFPYCRFTDAGGGETVAVVGDSHAHAAYPAIADFLKNRGINTVLLANSSCPPLLGVPILGKMAADRVTCQAKMDGIIRVLLSKRDIDEVVFVVRGSIYITGTEPLSGNTDVMDGAAVGVIAYRAGTQRTINKLAVAGKKILYVTENPELSVDPAVCITRPLRTMTKRCDIDKATVLARQKAYLDMTRSIAHVVLVNGVDTFCPTDKCLVFDDDSGALLYADDDHLSLAGSRYLVKHTLASLLPPGAGQRMPH